MPKKQLIIGLVGEKLSGKGTVAEYLAQKYDAKVLRMSRVLDDLLKRLHLPIERKNQIDLAIALREKFGEDILAQTLKQDIEKDPARLIVIDGIRMPREVKIFENLFGFILVSVRAPLKLRFARMKDRQEKLDEQTMDFTEFKRIEAESPTETSIAEICAQARIKIENRGSFEQLYAKVQEDLLARYYSAA